VISPKSKQNASCREDAVQLTDKIAKIFLEIFVKKRVHMASNFTFRRDTAV
jgi:hypothetical protein